MRKSGQARREQKFERRMSMSQQRKADGLPSPHAVHYAMKGLRKGNGRVVLDKDNPVANAVYLNCWFRNMTPREQRRECARLQSQE